MAKILFVNPVVREEDNPKHIPYGLALLAQIAIDKGHEVQMYDANAWRKGDDVLAGAFKADDWDVIAIGGLTTSYTYIKRACKIAKSVAPDAFIMAGGGFITSMPLEIMEWIPEIDLGVIGEGFVTFPEVLQQIDENDLDFTDTLGVCYRDGAGEPVLTPTRPNIYDLDVLPFPAWDLFPLDIYFANSQLLYSEEAFLSKRRIDINGSLGCNFVCRYCWHLGTTGDMVIEPDENGKNDVRFSWGRNIRYHSPQYIVEMAKTLHKKYGVDFISFIDENLMTMDSFSKRTWLNDLCEEWIKAGLQPQSRLEKRDPREGDSGVFWSGTSHANLARKPILEKMFDAGCSHLVYGIESFDPGILKTLGKGCTQKQNLEAPGICMSTGIKPIPNIIIGFPDESFDSIRNTMDGMVKIGLYAKPHFATPYPGSEWYYAYKHNILEQYDGDLEKFIMDLGDASSPSAIISHRFSAMDLLGLQQIVAQRDYRLLDQAEKHWNGAEEHKKPLAYPKESFNFIKKKVKAPIESESRAL